MAEFTPEDKELWVELSRALGESGCDSATVRGIVGNRHLPPDLRPQVWQVLLGVAGKPDPMTSWEKGKLPRDLEKALGGLSISPSLSTVLSWYLLITCPALPHSPVQSPTPPQHSSLSICDVGAGLNGGQPEREGPDCAGLGARHCAPPDKEWEEQGDSRDIGGGEQNEDKNGEKEDVGEGEHEAVGDEKTVEKQKGNDETNEMAMVEAEPTVGFAAMGKPVRRASDKEEEQDKVRMKEEETRVRNSAQLLSALSSLTFDQPALARCLHALCLRFRPRNSSKAQSLLQLLLQYHEPCLSCFLNSHRVSLSFTQPWFGTLFADCVPRSTLLLLWDWLFQQGDAYLLLFLALVLIVNAKDVVVAMEKPTQNKITTLLSSLPSELRLEDVDDFVSLAQHYVGLTPVSFRSDSQWEGIFGRGVGLGMDAEDDNVLCLPVGVAEIIQSFRSFGGVSLLVVDCRTEKEYKSSHLVSALHLDAQLIYSSVVEFAAAASIVCRKRHDPAEEASRGQSGFGGPHHLCLMGSGRHHEEPTLNMVAAHFLQKNMEYVSIARGGYKAVLQYLNDIGSGENGGGLIVTGEVDREMQNACESHGVPASISVSGLVSRMSSALRTGSAAVKQRVQGLMDSPPEHRPYRGVKPVFTISDNDSDAENSSDDESREKVNEKRDRHNRERQNETIERWLKKPGLLGHFCCSEILPNGSLIPCHLFLTPNQLVSVQELRQREQDKQGIERFVYCPPSRRLLSSLSKMTSKRREARIVTLRWGEGELEKVDRYFIQDSAEVTKKIKVQVMKVLEGETTMKDNAL
uniref:TBC1 domain family member 23 n=1 Tax=Eptatretus burgeri TaxID=7764 RepID=A0A8C4QP15_EPTBU